MNFNKNKANKDKTLMTINLEVARIPINFKVFKIININLKNQNWKINYNHQELKLMDKMI